MISLWVLAAVASALVAAFLLRAALRPETESAGRDSSAETSRRVLGTPEVAARPAAPSWAAPAICIGAPLLASAIYMAVGSPGASDRPYVQRVAEWRSDPERLGPIEAAAVLTSIARERPEDPEAFGQLARARLASGDGFGAVRAAEAAARLQPALPARWTALAEALLALEPPAISEARTALTRAEALAPDDVDAAYWRGRAAFTAGDPVAGEALWRALLSRLPPADVRRASLEMELASILSPSTPDLDPVINAMVDGLAARLRSEPLDPQGWARLVQAYGVLGRLDDQATALAEARRTFAQRPEVLAELEAAAKGRARSR